MLKIIPQSRIFLGLSLVTFVITDCSKPSFREEFFKQRHCPEVRYQCLPESQEKKMLALSQPYQLTDEDARIKQDDTLRLHREVIKMLDIYYPNFWQDTDEKTQLAWMEKVDEITKRYYPNRQRYHLERMASVCAIIGVNFENNPDLGFVVQKIKNESNYYGTLIEINDYLRFEVLGKDYDEAGNQYNNWSLRGVRQGTPPMTRHVPDFNTEWKPYNPDENVERIYDRWLNDVGKKR